jgi:hypothetical protein
MMFLTTGSTANLSYSIHYLLYMMNLTFRVNVSYQILIVIPKIGLITHLVAVW